MRNSEDICGQDCFIKKSFGSAFAASEGVTFMGCSIPKMQPLNWDSATMLLLARVNSPRLYVLTSLVGFGK